MDHKSFIAPVSKAVAGAVVAVIISLLAQYDLRLGEEHKGALELLLNGGIAALIGFVVVYLAPKNKGVK